MNTLTAGIHKLSRLLNYLAAVAILAMMLLTCADVVLRFFRRPVPGTYELVGFMGAVFVSFSLGQTSLDRGHIAVDFLVRKFSQKTQQVVEAINAAVCCVMFAFICRQSAVYADTVRQAGEVSMTLQMPLHPIIYGIAVGCGVLSAVLLLGVVQAIMAAIRPSAGVTEK